MRRTRLTLVVAAGVGHDPIRAVGLLMVYLERIAHMRGRTAQISLLKPGKLVPTTPDKQINLVAKRQARLPIELLREEQAAIDAS